MSSNARAYETASSSRGATLQAVLAFLPPCLAVGYLLVLEGAVPDLAAHFKAERAAAPEFSGLLRFLTDWGNFVFYALYAAILVKGWRMKDKARIRFVLVYLVVQLAISFALVRVLKIGLGCPRPGVEGLCVPGSFDGGHNALPSGHTVEITGAALPLAMRWGSSLLSLALGGFVALMAYSRVYLGWHSPADVAFGLIFGLFAASLIHSYGRSS